MLGYYLLLFPFAVCFGYLMQMLMRRNKTPLLKVVTCQIAALACYFLCYSYECDPNSSATSLLIADLAKQWITPLAIPLGMAIMNGLRHKKMFTTAVCLWFIPGILSAIAGTMVHVLGWGEEAHHRICGNLFDLVTGIEMVYFFVRNFLHMGGRDFAWERLITFFTKNSASRPLMVIGVSYNVFMLCLIGRFLYTPSSFYEFLILGGIRLVVISMVLLMLFNALSQVNSPWITLKSIFDTSKISIQSLDDEEALAAAESDKSEDEPLPSEIPTMTPAESKVVLERIDRLSEALHRFMIDEQAYLQSDISIEKVAAHLGTNRFYISRMINVEQSMTFRDYINSLRIEYAKTYLKQHMNVTQDHVAYACGFSSASYFNRKFKQMTGISPQDWRKN